MKLTLVMGVMIISMVLVGCSSGSIPSHSDAIDLENTLNNDNQYNTEFLSNEPPLDRNWITPGRVNVTHYYAGGVAEYPITVHNGGDGWITDTKRVTTEQGESSCAIELNHPLLSDNITDVQVTSDNVNDAIIVKSVNLETNKVSLLGLEENKQRVLTFYYRAYATFNVSYCQSDNVAESYEKAPLEAQDWVIIADSTVLMEPYATKDVLVSLAMPEETVAPDKWEFLVCVQDATRGGTVQAANCSRWLIAMR